MLRVQQLYSVTTGRRLEPAALRSFARNRVVSSLARQLFLSPTAHHLNDDLQSSATTFRREVLPSSSSRQEEQARPAPCLTLASCLPSSRRRISLTTRRTPRATLIAQDMVLQSTSSMSQRFQTFSSFSGVAEAATSPSTILLSPRFLTPVLSLSLSQAWNTHPSVPDPLVPACRHRPRVRPPLHRRPRPLPPLNFRSFIVRPSVAARRCRLRGRTSHQRGSVEPAVEATVRGGRGGLASRRERG